MYLLKGGNYMTNDIILIFQVAWKMRWLWMPIIFILLAEIIYENKK
jgi:hypothetical protein